jgi:hypothetical protein
MTKEIEDIIMNKKFFELTAEEKNLIHEFAETEIDFEQLKFVFTQIKEIKRAEKPNVDEAVKANLDVLFDKTFAHKRLAWHNKLWLVLWPEDTRFYARPLVQFATVLVLIISVVTLVPFSEKPQLAMNESTGNSLNNKSTTELEVAEETMEELLNVTVEKATEQGDRVSEVLEQGSGNGWTIAEVEVSPTDAIASESVNPSRADFSYSGASAQDVPTLEQPIEEKFYALDADDVTLTRSVTTSQPKAFSPKEKPEVFDILTALY